MTAHLRARSLSRNRYPARSASSSVTKPIVRSARTGVCQVAIRTVGAPVRPQDSVARALRVCIDGRQIMVPKSVGSKRTVKAQIAVLFSVFLFFSSVIAAQFLARDPGVRSGSIDAGQSLYSLPQTSGASNF